MSPYSLQHRFVVNKTRPHQSSQRTVGQNASPEVGSGSNTEGGKVQTITQHVLHRRFTENAGNEDRGGKVIEDDAGDTGECVEEERCNEVTHACDWRNAGPC